MKQHSRRRFLKALAVAAPSLALSGRLVAQAEIPDTVNPGIGPYPGSWLPEGIRSRFVDGVNGLRMHVLEAGYETPDRPAARTAEEWAKMPTYYIMDLAEGMAETVAHHMPAPEQVAANNWLTEAELAVYATEFGRTGFQGGLNSYRMGATGIGAAESQLYAGKTMDQPISNWWLWPGTWIPALRRQNHGPAQHVHQRRERLGHLPESRQFRAHAGNSLHRHARRAPGRRRRTLGATGAGGRNQPPAAGISERSLKQDSPHWRKTPALGGGEARAQPGLKDFFSKCAAFQRIENEARCDIHVSLDRNPVNAKEHVDRSETDALVAVDKAVVHGKAFP